MLAQILTRERQQEEERKVDRFLPFFSLESLSKTHLSCPFVSTNSVSGQNLKSRNLVGLVQKDRNKLLMLAKCINDSSRKFV